MDTGSTWVRVLASIRHSVFLPDFMDQVIINLLETNKIAGFYTFLAKSSELGAAVSQTIVGINFDIDFRHMSDFTRADKFIR